MRYKQLIQEKLDQLNNINKNMSSSAQRGQFAEFRQFSTNLDEKIDEIRTLISTQTGTYE